MKKMKQMKKMKKIACIALAAFAALTFSAESSLLPDSLARPQKGEAPRYPQDVIIGALGRGAASEEAYAFAKRTLEGCLNGQALPAEVRAGSEGAIAAIAPQKVRLGGGREEAAAGSDGGTAASFLFRFIGRESWIAGEIYVRYREAGATAQNPPPPAETAIPTSAAEAPAADALPPETAAALPDPATESGEPAEPEQSPAAPDLEAAPSAPAAPPNPVPAGWVVDDIILDAARANGDTGAAYQYDFSPYERFF
jgi:hypothetical protein